MGSVSPSRADANRYIQNVMRCGMSVNINKDTMVKVRTDVTHKCVGNENSKTNLFDLQQTKGFENSLLRKLATSMF